METQPIEPNSPAEGVSAPAQAIEEVPEDTRATETTPAQDGREPTPVPMHTVEIWTDGSCSPNPGAGGWAVLLRSPQQEKELSGFVPETTSVRMEMIAAIEGLEALKRPLRVSLYTDSELVIKGMTQWLAGWKEKDWRGSDKKPVKNRDLWERLEAAATPHEVEWNWVRGHAGHPENERVDRLAKAAIHGRKA